MSHFVKNKIYPQDFIIAVLSLGFDVYKKEKVGIFYDILSGAPA